MSTTMNNDLPENLDRQNLEFSYAYDLIMQTRESVFLTGKAGTGKSTFLRVISQETDKNHVILAPTGIAAINAKGETIHGFFRLPLGPLLPNDKRLSDISLSRNKQKLINKLDLIIIDEISMVRADIIDALDSVLRRVTKQRNRPFGGKQLLFVGDLYQLEPVTTGEDWEILEDFYDTPYFFGARVFSALNLVNIELQKIYRQTDQTFVSLLNSIREGSITDQQLETLNEQVTTQDSGYADDFSITLTTTHQIANQINSRNLSKLPGDPFVLQGIIDGDFPEKNLPTAYELSLKPGAQVIFIRNDYEGQLDAQNGMARRWVNGTIGKVEEFNDQGLWIRLQDDSIEEVKQETWERIQYQYDDQKQEVVEQVKGSFIQYPLKLAWAVTIHKSQGLTFDNCYIDLGRGAFAGGQLYVALSRCRSLDGLGLRTKVRYRDVIVREEVKAFYQTMNDEQLIQNLLKGSS
jgi:hypothetical protein